MSAENANDGGNPNLSDVPVQSVVDDNSRARQDDEDQQVMGAQHAKAKAKAPTMLNGTYGSVGPMMMDDEVRESGITPGVQGEATSSGTGRAVSGPSAASLRAAAGKVMATVAAKVQEVMPPSGRNVSAASFLAQEDAGSAGTVGSGYVTAGSEPPRESPVMEERDRGQQGLFSPQQARSLQQMEAEAPLLYPGEDGGARPTSPLPQLPHSTSSGSDQAEAIQAEVKRQMQSYLIVQAELQQRVAVLVEENQVLRQVAASNEAGSEVQGSQAGKGGWFSGIRRNILGLVQQVPMKAAGMPLAIPEGWAASSSSFLAPPPAPGVSINATSEPQSQRQQPPVVATAISPSVANPTSYSLVPTRAASANMEPQSHSPWQSLGIVQGLSKPSGLGLFSVPKTGGAQGAGIGYQQGAQGAGIGDQQSAQGAGISYQQGAQGAGIGDQQGAQGAGIGCQQGAQGAGIGYQQGAQGVGIGYQQGAQGAGIGYQEIAQGAGVGQPQGAQGVGAGYQQGAQGAGTCYQYGTSGVRAEGIAHAPQGTGEGGTIGATTGCAQKEDVGAQASPNPPLGSSRNPFEAMLTGMVQLQNVVADLAASKQGGHSGVSSGGPEVVRPGVTELVKLPLPTLEGALGFSDWIHAVKPSMSDLSDTSGECWERVLQEARDWYNNHFVPANPINRVRLKVPASSIDRESRWSRVRHRMEHWIIQSCPDVVKSELSSARISGIMGILCRLHVIYKPGGVAERAEALRQVQHPRAADSAVDAVLRLRTWKRWMTRLSDLGGASPDAAICAQALESITGGILKSLPGLSFRVNLVRASLHLDTQPTSAKVGEYYEHLLVELEAVSRITDAQSGSPNATKPEGGKGVKQVDAKSPSTADVSQPQREPKGPKATGAPSGGDSPKKLCKWFHEGKGCKRGKDCRFLHDWNQIPKADRLERCMACGGRGHRKDACTNSPASAKRDDGASSAKAAKAEAPQRAKGQDPGLKKVLSEAAGVLREVLSSQATSGDSTNSGHADQHQQAANATASDPSGSGGSESPIAAAAKIQAQLESLESQILDGGPRIRAVSCGDQELQEPTALLDSGATHAVLDASSVEKSSLVPCTVSLAGDQRQTWHQTPGGSLVAPGNGDGAVTQTILPLGCLIEQLGCSVRWSRKGGLQLFHPRLGRLRTSLRSGCPQLGREQALQLIRELEAAKLQELSGRRVLHNKVECLVESWLMNNGMKITVKILLTVMMPTIC